MPASNFNSAATDSAFFWVRSAAGWDMISTTGYDFITYLHEIINESSSVPEPITGTWLGAFNGTLVSRLRRLGPIATRYAENIIADTSINRRIGKDQLLGAAWLFAHATDADRTPGWGDVIIPGDTIMPTLGVEPPHAGPAALPRVIPASTAPPPPLRDMTPEQTAPVTVIDAPHENLPVAPGDPSSVVVQTSTGPRPISAASPPVVVQTSTGIRTMPVTMPQPRPRSTARATQRKLLIAGGVVLGVAGFAYIAYALSRPTKAPTKRARGR